MPGDALSAPFTSLFILMLFLHALFLISPTKSVFRHPCLSEIEKEKKKDQVFSWAAGRQIRQVKQKNNGKKMIKKHSRWIRISFPADTGKEMTMVSLEKLLLLQRTSASANSWPNKTFSFVPYLKYPKLTPSTLAT